jgi:hypothetical protein
LDSNKTEANKVEFINHIKYLCSADGDTKDKAIAEKIPLMHNIAMYS